MPVIILITPSFLLKKEFTFIKLSLSISFLFFENKFYSVHITTDYNESNKISDNIGDIANAYNLILLKNEKKGSDTTLIFEASNKNTFYVKNYVGNNFYYILTDCILEKQRQELVDKLTEEKTKLRRKIVENDLYCLYLSHKIYDSDLIIYLDYQLYILLKKHSQQQ